MAARFRVAPRLVRAAGAAERRGLNGRDLADEITRKRVRETQTDNGAPETPSRARYAGRLQMVPSELIVASQDQGRSKANERVGLEALKASITEDGFNSATVVRPREDRFRRDRGPPPRHRDHRDRAGGGIVHRRTGRRRA